MSFRYEAFYLVEPRPELADRLRGRVEPDFAEVLLEPRLYRRQEQSQTVWFERQRLAQTKLLFLASLSEYTPVADDGGFASVFGSVTLGVALFDRWFVVRRFQIEQELGVMEVRLREVVERVEPPGVALVDEWLAELRHPVDTPGRGGTTALPNS